MGGSSPCTRPSASGCGNMSKALASESLDRRRGSFARTAPGSLSTHRPVVLSMKRKETAFNVQSGLRKGLVQSFRTASFERGRR